MILILIMVQKIPKVFYLYIHSKLYDRNKRRQIKRSDLLTYVSSWGIPKKIRPLIIKELEVLELIKYKHQIFFINKPLLNDNNINTFYDALGMYD